MTRLLNHVTSGPASRRPRRDLEFFIRKTRAIDYDLRMPNTKTQAYAAQSAKTALTPFTIERREPGARDVSIDIFYCGVCHSDLHTARGEWGGVKFPCVPGHEIVGRVSTVGSQVSRVKVGEFVGVGCMVDSCRTCSACQEGLEQYCEGPNGFTGTYNG